jgi:hypothetical protein
VLPGMVILLAEMFAGPNTPQSAPKFFVDAMLHVHWGVEVLDLEISEKAALKLNKYEWKLHMNEINTSLDIVTL